ncbi:MAG TPA: hypothetical protein VHT91_15690 [Kofleriaceae bacterium]|jgi:hypothetical protein|nr:hypothetical protein [Kofleriaceae bacterium]
MRKPAKPEKPNKAPKLRHLDNKQLEDVTGGDGDGKGGSYYGDQ